MRIVLLGAPGSGKGTQAKLIAKAYKAPHVPMNDLLRAAVAADTPFGRQAKAAAEAGQPITDEVMLGVVQERLSQQDASAKFILDGFPRNLSQAEALDALMEQHGQSLQAAVLIDVDFETLLQRFTGRRTCVSCGKTYNIYTSPSRLDDRCDECGGNLRHRADEKEETISNRLRVYETQTAPLIEYYRRKGLLRVVPGAGEIDDIFKEISKVLDSLALEEKAVAEKPVAPAKKEEAKAATLTRAAKAALTAAEEEIKTITQAARSVEKKAVRTAKKIVRAAEKEAKAATKAVRTFKKKAVRTTKKLLEKAEKAVAAKKKAKAAAKPAAAKKAPPAKKVAAKAVVKKVAVKKTAVKAAPKKALKSVVAKKGAVKKAAVKKKAAPAKAVQKATEKRR